MDFCPASGFPYEYTQNLLAAQAAEGIPKGQGSGSGEKSLEQGQVYPEREGMTPDGTWVLKPEQGSYHSSPFYLVLASYSVSQFCFVVFFSF